MIEISSELNSYRLQGVVDFLALGSNPPYVEIYEGLRPAFKATPIGALLVTLPLQDPVGTVSNGILTLNPSEEAQVLVDGTASWARVYNGSGGVAWDCDVSVVGGAGELKVVSLNLYAGGFARIVSGTLI